MLFPAILGIVGFLATEATCDFSLLQPQAQFATQMPADRPNISAIANKTTPQKTASWVLIKKHLKRYWRRYALAAVATFIAIDQLRARRTPKKTPSQALQIFAKPSPLERLFAYQYQLILRALQWSPRPLLQQLRKNTRIAAQRALLLRTKTSDFITHHRTAFKKRQRRPEEVSRLFQPHEITLTDLFTLAPKTPFTLKETGKSGQTLQGKEKITVFAAFADNIPLDEKSLQIFNYFVDNESRQYGVDANGSLYRRFHRTDKESGKFSSFFEECDISELRGKVVGYTEDRQPLFAAGPQEINPVNDVEYTPTTRIPGKSREPLMPVAHYNAFRLKVVPSFDPAGNYLGVPAYDNKPFRALSSQGFTPPTLRQGIVNADFPEFFNLPPGSTALAPDGNKWYILGHFVTDTEVDNKQQSAILQRICKSTTPVSDFTLYAFDTAGRLYVNHNGMSHSSDCYRCAS